MSTSEHTTGDRSFEALLRDLARAPAVKLADLDLSGRTLGRFEVRRRIGVGGMGAVYEAWDTRLLRVVALKVLHAWKGQGRGDDAAARLVAEARRAAAVSHPCIAAVYDVDTFEGITFLAEERIEGRSLDRVLAAGGLRAEEALRIARRVASALACAHLGGIVHRDLTPANVMIGVGGAVKLLDFGIATSSASSAGGPTGTPGYMAPEQIAGGVVDARADVFSFGVLLEALLAGRPRPGTEALVGEARRLAERCTARDPGDRPADGGALVGALRGLGRARSSAPPSRAPGRRIGVAAAVSALVALSILPLAAPRAMLTRQGHAPAARVAPEEAHAPDPAAAMRARRARIASARLAEERGGEPLNLLRPSALAPGAHPPAPGDPLAIFPVSGEAFELPPSAELPVTTYVDDEGRLITVADLRGVDARRMAALGGLMLRAAPGSGAAEGEPELRRGTLGVSQGPRGTMRITLDLEVTGRTASLEDPSSAELDHLSGGSGVPAHGAREPGSDLAAGSGGTLSKGVDLGAFSDEESGARSWLFAVCGVSFTTSLTLRLSAAGAVEIVPSLDALGGIRPPLAVIDPERGLLRAAPGVRACAPGHEGAVEL